MVNLGFSPGVAYSLSHRWQSEILFPNVVFVQYFHSQTNYTFSQVGYPPTQSEEHDVNNGFSFSTSLTTNFQLQVGLRYMIGS